MVRIVDVREITKPISSPIRNAYIDFTKMTTSLVAVVTDVKRDGKTVVGYGFNSNGRYGQGGLIRERFAARITEADPKSLLDASGDNLDPDKVWAAMMSNEKPGGHGERSVAVGTIDMAVWDAVAKIAGKPLFRLLAERHGRTADPRVFVYAAGGYYYPGKDLSALRGEMRGYLDRGYNVVKMKIGGAPIAEDRKRIEAGAEGDRQQRATRGRRQRPLRSGNRDRLRQDAARLSAVLVRGSRRSARLSSCRPRWPSSIRARWRPAKTCSAIRTRATCSATAACGPIATGCNSIARCPTGCANTSARSAVLQTLGWSPSRCIPHGGHQMSLNIAAGLGLGGNESYPDLFQPYGGFPDGVRVENGHITMPDLPGIGFEGKSDLYKEMKALAS